MRPRLRPERAAPFPAGRWQGATVVCIASGPSLTEDDCGLVARWREAAPHSRRVIVVNSSYRLAPFADVLYGCDTQWWTHTLAAVRSSGFGGELWTQSEESARDWGLHRVPLEKNTTGLCLKPGCITGGSNSGYQAINLAVQFGAARIVLLGYDFQRTRGLAHWHGDHPRPMGNLGNLVKWREHMAVLARDLEVAQIPVVNATRETALTCFARQPLAEALAPETVPEPA